MVLNVYDWVVDQYKKLPLTDFSKKIVAGAMAGLILGIPLVFGLKWHRKHQNAQAYTQLYADVADLQQILGAKDQNWESLEALYKNHVEEFSSTDAAPYFMKLYAQVLSMRGDAKDALAVTDRMMTNVDSTHPLFPVFALQRALLGLDQDDEQVRTTALEQLKGLAHDEHNTYRDAALYYLGSYFWVNEQLAESMAAWQELVSLQKDAMVVSPWAQRVVPLMEQIRFLAAPQTKE